MFASSSFTVATALIIIGAVFTCMTIHQWIERRRLRQMKAADVKVTPEHPELDVKGIARAIVRKGLKPIPPKTSVSLRIDVDVLDWRPSKHLAKTNRARPLLFHR